MVRYIALVVAASLAVSACGITSADRPSCLALAEAYVSIIRETVDEGVPADVTERTLERAEFALQAAIDDGNTDQEARCRVILDIALAARDMAPADFARLWAGLEEQGVDPSR